MHVYLSQATNRVYENQSVSGVTTICLMQCITSPLHKVDQVVDCGMWCSIAQYVCIYVCFKYKKKNNANM